MRHARSLLPYVIAAVVIAAGSAVLVFATVDRAGATPGATTNPRSAPELSTTGRLAYWRQTPAGTFVLWAANLDGSQARPLTTLPTNSSRPFGTRWTGGGRAVAFVTDTGIGVIALDGSRKDLTLAESVRNAGFRITDQRWSPSGDRVAATLFRSTDSRAEVYLGSLDRQELVPVGLANVFAGDWISDSDVLVESDRGVLSVLSPAGTGVRSRRLVEQSAASPFFDGSRVFFLAGPIGGSGDATGFFVGNPSVWSVLPDGTGARQETRLQSAGNLRLDGIWPDGRYLMRVFRDATVYIAGPRSFNSLAPSTLIRRAVVSADRRSALGFAGSRIVRVDLSRGLNPSDATFVVLLADVFGSDAWVPRGGAP